MALVQAGLLDQLREDLDYQVDYDGKVHHYEDITPTDDPDHRGMKKPRSVSAVTEKLSSQVYSHAREGKFVLTLGGDHSIAVGSISGTQKAVRERLGRETAVIWVDAHADINIPEMSPSGNIHGMPMAFLTRLAREEKKDIFGWLGEEHTVSTRKLVYIGLRDVDRGEKKLLRENGIKAFSMHDIDRYFPLPPFNLLMSEFRLTNKIDTASAALSKWPSPILATTPPSIFPSMSTAWIRIGPPAPAPPCEAASRCARAISSASACTRRGTWWRWIWSR